MRRVPWPAENMGSTTLILQQPTGSDQTERGKKMML